MSAPSFALIAEGESDYQVIRHLLAGFFSDSDIVVNQIQPAVDATGRGDKPAGGWFEVLRFCRSEKFPAAFQFNEYVVIQIDTDVCEESGFDVSRRDAGGVERSVEQMIDATRARLIETIGAEIYAQHAERILFAICVEAIECWLLPLYANDNRRGKHVNCLGTLNELLSKKEGFSIDPDRKQVKYYKQIVKPYARPKKLDAHADENPSLARFVANLRAAFP